jgi:predicted nucleotidyltransferase
MVAKKAEEAIERVSSYFAYRDEFRLVIVYGYAAKGHFNAASDVDVAVAGSGVLHRGDRKQDACHAGKRALRSRCSGHDRGSCGGIVAAKQRAI